MLHNPGRDRGRVIGRATVTGQIRDNPQPVRFGHRVFPHECSLRLSGLTAPFTGLELAPLVAELEAFPDPATWSARMRRALVPLPKRDAALIRRLVDPLLDPPEHHVASYVELVSV